MSNWYKKASLDKEAIGAPKAPGKGQHGHGLGDEAMKLLWQYDIEPGNLWRYDSPDSPMKEVYEGIQRAKQGDIEALRQALESRFGKKNILQKKIF